MKTDVINSIVEAATALHNALENAIRGQIWGFCWGGGTTEHLAALRRLNELANEYTSNMLEAQEPARVKDYYRRQIEHCKALCPYPDCGFYRTPIIDATKCVLAAAIDSAAKMHKRDCSDEEDKEEYLVRAYQYQSEFVGRIAALADWWQTIEPRRRLERLAEHPQANTEQAQKYFARAIDKGFMTETSTGYRWLRPEPPARGSKAALAYFLGQVYGNYTPDKELEALFGFNRLGDAGLKSKTPQASIIDKEIFGD